MYDIMLQSCKMVHWIYFLSLFLKGINISGNVLSLETIYVERLVYYHVICMFCMI